MSNFMAKIWRNCLEHGTQKFEDCPVRYKNQVRILLKQDVKDQIIRAEDYKTITGEEYVEDTTTSTTTA
jgi:hypothetical protein